MLIFLLWLLKFKFIIDQLEKLNTKKRQEPVVNVEDSEEDKTSIDYRLSEKRHSYMKKRTEFIKTGSVVQQQLKPKF
ncbi:unnamed protein product [Arctia plantaginis]|uniref:Uncharacterized protein n=1 Tax=Arctia plantaginis TaxID=874455 RepID=A0A8S1BJC8_ARCPL|nr:unnamed protein product [Arctia plantaginis]